ncbi:MAG: [FeFe] hydrogenase H-cluster maturation GTPase HydF [Spirochaetes bacterium]|nr:[FeFe] hydrogenase H-cluster maturation GTPase HydF [Spirochaetota bacterium]
MNLNETHSSNRVHIAFFGKRNAGKSSLVNAVTGQNIAVVSGIKGTTTDPVYKAMELLPLGPVVIIDTPGFDDEGELGELRVQKARQVLNKTDIAVLVLDELLTDTLSAAEEELVNIFKKKRIPYIIAYNKCDLRNDNDLSCFCSVPHDVSAKEIFIPVSAKTGFNINLLKEKIAAIAQNDEPRQPLIADLIKPLETVVLVIPIDKAAPKGRLILAQQQMIRVILDAGGINVAVRESELKETLALLGKKPALVITDSQVFAEVSAAVPQDVPLTSFSILFARYKGWLQSAVKGVSALDSLQNGDKILICEGCTHHRQCDDIGTVKLPRMIKKYTGKEPQFVFCSGGDFPQDLSCYKMVIHCGACMLNEREMQYRLLCAEDQNVPFTNYGITIAFIQGILKRSINMLYKDEILN